LLTIFHFHAIASLLKATFFSVPVPVRMVLVSPVSGLTVLALRHAVVSAMAA
jgi:hypothetical protein